MPVLPPFQPSSACEYGNQTLNVDCDLSHIKNAPLDIASLYLQVLGEAGARRSWECVAPSRGKSLMSFFDIAGPPAAR